MSGQPSRTKFSWTKSQDEKIIEFTHKGYRCSEIGVNLGLHPTAIAARQAVLGLRAKPGPRNKPDLEETDMAAQEKSATLFPMPDEPEAGESIDPVNEEENSDEDQAVAEDESGTFQTLDLTDPDYMKAEIRARYLRLADRVIEGEIDEQVASLSLRVLEAAGAV